MSLIQITKNNSKPEGFPLFFLGFRPFFLGAGVLAIISILIWVPFYLAHISLPLKSISSFQWHAHEMIYGYGMAVISGFLLTAIMNWTGVQTISGKQLAVLFSSWCVARILFLFGTRFIEIAALFDGSFIVYLLYALAKPIFQVRQWKQMGILSKIIMLAVGNLSFYLGVFGILGSGVYWGIYGGLYTIVALILVIGGRVLPIFIQNGVDYEVIIPNPKWITGANLLLFTFFFLNQLFVMDIQAEGYLSFLLFLVNTLRLLQWHTRGIWKKPLLWGLFISFVFIDIGFLLFAMSAFKGVSPFLAIHAFAFGGIGMATVAMMSRVILGHTGRNIRIPPRLTTISLILLLTGGVFRVLFPLFNTTNYFYWLIVAQVLWIGAFVLFLLSYSKMLFLARVDGKPG